MERLTLEEAIKHAKEIADMNYNDAEKFDSNDSVENYMKGNCMKCAEQGLLVRLPCKVGDDVYIIPSPSVYCLNIINGYEKHNKIHHQHVGTIVITAGHWYATSREEYGVYNEKVLNDIAYGITWFTDYEEAEKKLEEMKK